MNQNGCGAGSRRAAAEGRAPGHVDDISLATLRDPDGNGSLLREALWSG
ncbi:MAG: hypothetical protein AVDCRST_MAG93-1014 [uncultured Chloroflexia bacterium]|uniref:Uncharacterized protein n=1 Tax=uncultured Chloroflexia bacterium TaxID=1672391 RepID=A0A6J4HU63_9CHLR|nr:MAG: hypothetical protein AVDCRST_MAG93-1014 [uncultured Chloroflexia bacterium]